MKDAISKVVNYLKAFSEQQRVCLAIYTSLCISEGEDGSIVVYCNGINDVIFLTRGMEGGREGVLLHKFKFNLRACQCICIFFFSLSFPPSPLSSLSLSPSLPPSLPPSLSLSPSLSLPLSPGILTQDVINNLFLNVLCAEHLVKEESLGLSFTIVLFRTWIEEKGIVNVGSVLRKTRLEDQLLVS